MKKFIIAFFLFFLPAAFAQEMSTADQQRYQDLTEELRCLVCQNESLADSDAPLAKDLRQEIKNSLLAGQSNEEIIHYLTARYGEFILFKPSLDAKNSLLWLGPFALLVLGLFVFIFLIYRRRDASSTLSEQEKHELERLLK